MKIETSSTSIRIPFHSGKCFVDIHWVSDYPHNALMIQSLTGFSFWAVIKLNNESQYDPYRVVAFPNKIWFNEWYDSQEIKPDIIFSNGKESEV
jgi:endoglucanase Acf2